MTTTTTRLRDATLTATLAALVCVGSARSQALSAGSCPPKQREVSGGGDQWHAWTTHGCDANCAAAGLVDSAGLVCAYADATSLLSTQRLRATSACDNPPTAPTAVSTEVPCFNNGECFVEFMSVKPTSVGADARSGRSSVTTNEWVFRLGDAASASRFHLTEQVQVGQIAVPPSVSRLTFDGRDGVGKPTAVRFATDLSSASSLTALIFIGIDLSMSTLPTLPDTLRELYIEDCIVRDVPLDRIASLKLLERFALRRTVITSGAMPSLSSEQLEALLARSPEMSATDSNRHGSDTIDRCPEGYARKELYGVSLCSGGGISETQRRLATNSSSVRSQNSSSTTTNSTSSESSSDGETTSTKSILIMVSFGAPALYFFYKLVLYVYFYCTYSKHVKKMQTVASDKSSETLEESGDDRRTTEKESTGSPPESLVLPPVVTTASHPASIDQRRFNNMSFWVEEELQDWRMDFKQVKMLKCLTTTTNQKRRTRESAVSSVLSGCEVWLGTFYPQGAPDAEQPVVLKWIPSKQKEALSPLAADKFKGEIKRLAQLSHPNVVKFFGIVWSVDTHLVAVTEYMARGDLRQWLHRSARTEAGRWSAQKVQILLDIAKALLYLHSLRPAPLLHGNCNSRNVLLNDRMKAKLSDFGSTKEGMSERELMAYGAVGSGRWISPEALVGHDSRVSSAITGAADVYSLGILMSELDTHELPFSDLMQANNAALPETDVLRLIAKGALSPTLSPTCPPQIRTLIERCTSYSPKSRPSSRDVVQQLQEIHGEMKAAASATRDSNDSDDSEDIVRSMKLSRGVVV